MTSPLENAITLEEVFAMVVGKRVPLAPELAGYLSLEVAEKADASGLGGGDVDPRSVFIADEGTVALVRRRSDPGEGDAEQSIRTILAQLLDASGSSTPALTAVSRRHRSGSLRTLMEDIEAALIPVNRAAGRRALARLAREVKRVTQGVGRNAPSARSPSGASTARASRPGTEEPTSLRRLRESAPEPRTATRMAPLAVPPSAMSPSSRGASAAPSTASAPGVRPNETRPFPAALPVVRPPPERRPSVPVGPVGPTPPARLDPPAGPLPSALFDNPSDVDSLLEQFSRSTTQTDEAVSRDLKDLVDVGPTAAPPPVEPVERVPRTELPGRAARVEHADPPSFSPAAEIDDLLSLTDEYPGGDPPHPSPAADAASPADASPWPSPLTTAPKSESLPLAAASFPPPSSRLDVETNRSSPVNPRDLPTHQSIRVSADWSRPKKKRTDYWVIIALLAVLAGASAIVWLFKPGFLSGRTAEKVAEEKAANEAARQKAIVAQQSLSCRAAVDVSDVPTGAEVLIRVGQAPVDVPRLPVGARLEFVATAEGFAPKRVVVPAAAAWDNGTDGKPRFELAVQLDHSNPKAKLGDSWPPGEAGSEVGGKGAPGTVHLVSTPRGAEVWMLAGLGPEAMVEQLPCDQPVDVLVAGPTTYRKRLHAAPSDFSARPGEVGSKIAKLNAR